MTYEEAKRVLTGLVGYLNMIDSLDEPTLEGLRIGIEAIEKQMPKKPVYAATKKYKNIFDGSEVEVHEIESCPACGYYPLETRYVRLPSCPKCNQKIEWGG